MLCEKIQTTRESAGEKMFRCFWFFALFLANQRLSEAAGDDFELVDRKGWNARPPKQAEAMANPVPFVIIHHSYKPAACDTLAKCARAMRSMQDYHMDERGWWDIGYSFGVGSDGRAYAGRGWSVVGAHAPKYNSRSVGICVIGDWRFQLPPSKQLDTVKALIKLGVDEGKIAERYKLLGHRQVRDTECPGDALFDEIKTWGHFAPTPDDEDDNEAATV